jgi:hypothetical protein
MLTYSAQVLARLPPLRLRRHPFESVSILTFIVGILVKKVITLIATIGAHVLPCAQLFVNCLPDNYQGEESDIVIASLTRSNKNNDIGFMFAEERLNVLLSRARNAFIMIGNAKTFQNARKGKEAWSNLFNSLRSNGHFYEGLPTKCERHPERQAILRTPAEFEEHAPDGGCSEPWYAFITPANIFC